MPKERHIVGMENGHSYTLVFQTNQSYRYASDQPKEWRWFLEIEGEFIGSFDAKWIATGYLHGYTHS